MTTALLPITSALSDESRLRILASLRAGELCACHIIELLALAPSTVSKHMDILRRAGLVLARKEGRWMHYRLAGRDAPPLVRDTLTWLWRSLDGSEQAAADGLRLKVILSLDPEALCCTQRKTGPGTAVPLKGLGCGPACCSAAPATPCRSPKARPARSRGM